MKKSSKNLLLGIGMIATGLLVGSILKKPSDSHITTNGTSAEKVSPTLSNHTTKTYIEDRKKVLKEKAMAAKAVKKEAHIVSPPNRDSSICVSEITDSHVTAEEPATIDEK